MKDSILKKPIVLVTLSFSWWQKIQGSFWFLPTAMVLAAVTLALILIAIDSRYEMSFIDDWTLLFGASASGSRDLLSTVASSMVTVAGVVFSITIVALSLTSSQYTSRVLRNFMRDKLNQSVLGVFVGIFAYCLVVLRVIRGGDEGAFVPSLAVVVALGLAFVGIGYLIFFIHYIAVSIQASSIIGSAARETIAAIDKLFPQELGYDVVDHEYEKQTSIEPECRWQTIASKKTGYIESIDSNSLLEIAEENKIVIRMECGVGEFIVEKTPLFSIAVPNGVEEEVISQLQTTYVIGRHRTVTQDAGFGIRQIVDIALKALSDGVNDTTTAVMCVDYLKAILVRLADRQIPTPLRVSDNTLRVIARGPTFQSLLCESFDQIRQSAAGNTAVLICMLHALEVTAAETTQSHRKELLRQQASLIVEVAEKTLSFQYDRDQVGEALSQFSQAL